ncbi:secretin N-terminal domain-containing protein [Brevundimonas sp.]|uniref:secretin N-terminal domain-containing protein n=1 Tax=Brevundimonas sp. TaxID=1871086 RepID=UPI0028982C39|nr:secretin N-terminal domain-containing protein [Brevundimonas sp.]
MTTLTHRPAATVLRRAGLRAAVCLAPMVILAGCAAFPEMNTMVSRPDTRVEGSSQDGLIGGGVNVDRGSRSTAGITTTTIPGAAAPAGPARQPATSEQIAALVSDEMVDANLSPQSIPQFAATVFGGVLKVPFTLAPDVATRTEVIAGGSGGPISKRALFALTQQALKQYGVEVYADGGFVTVGAASQGTGVEVNRNRTPSSSAGRVVQFYTVQTIEVSALQGLLQDLYPNLSGARITPDQLSNSLIISGPGREVAQVVRALREIDQPRYAGAEVLRIEPSFWATEALAEALRRTLVTEGYVIASQDRANGALNIQSFPSANQILIFGRDPEVLARARYWAETLDQPAALGDKASTFVYQVKNTDAASLGQMAMGQAPTTAQPRAPVGVPGTPAVQIAGANGGAQTNANGQGSTPPIGQGGQFMNGRVLTDPVGNRIIFTGTATEFAQLRGLLTTLDTPAPQVVIEVMIAEVTLTDNTSLGVQLFGTETRGDGVLSGGTEGIELGGGGLLMSFIGPEFRARLNAQASNNRVNILQRPQLVARSGGTARFQVGSDVPIITSQRASDNQSNNGTDILQSVQYRQTGVILDLQPVVYGDRVDITISQEISEVGESTNRAIASPPILNRSLTTQIAITDGWTGVLGGLISNNYSKVNNGIPFLKDVPLVGSAFQNNTTKGTRTELLILITPHVLRGDEDMADYAERYASDMNSAFRTGRGWSYTLTPFNVGFGVRGVGFDLPSPSRASERRAAEKPAGAAAAPTSPAVPDVTVTPPPAEPAAD